MYISALVLKCGICDSWILLNSHRFVAHPYFRAGRRSENLKGGGAIWQLVIQGLFMEHVLFLIRPKSREDL